MYKRSTYLNKITTSLMVLASTINSKNKLFLTDDNKWSEVFFRDLLNDVCSYKLVNLNVKEANYAGIDLGDSTNRVCVQVTASNTSTKIQDALSTSDKYKRYEEYDTPIILIIGFKKNYSSIFVSKFSNFDKDTCIWDIHTILKKISQLNSDQTKKLADFLDKELEGVVNIDPIELIDQDISAMIEVMYGYTQVNPDDLAQGSVKKYKIIKRDNDFITRKNELNNVDDILFNNEIRLSLQYEKKIGEFLGNPINNEQQKKYFIVTEWLQKQYSENTDRFNNMGSLFGFVFGDLVTYENRQEIDGQKLLILLHNMYFNCDIGNNPA